MKTILKVLLVLILVLVVSGCKSHEGSREYTPGKGWQQN